MKFLLLILLIFIFHNCGRVSEIHLGNNYYYVSEGGKKTFISLRNKEKLAIEKDIIMPTIVEYKYNNEYVIVYRVITEEMSKFYKDTNDEDWNKQLGMDIQYWLIEKHKNKVIGPLDKRHFSQIRDSLKIDLAFNKNY